MNWKSERLFWNSASLTFARTKFQIFQLVRLPKWKNIGVEFYTKFTTKFHFAVIIGKFHKFWCYFQHSVGYRTPQPKAAPPFSTYSIKRYCNISNFRPIRKKWRNCFSITTNHETRFLPKLVQVIFQERIRPSFEIYIYFCSTKKKRKSRIENIEYEIDLKSFSKSSTRDDSNWTNLWVLLMENFIGSYLFIFWWNGSKWNLLKNKFPSLRILFAFICPECILYIVDNVNRSYSVDKHSEITPYE